MSQLVPQQPEGMSDVQKYVSAEIQAENKWVSILANRLSIGQGFTKANVRSLSGYWRKFSAEMDDSTLCMSQVDAIAQQFIEYMADKKQKIETLATDQDFVLEVNVYVADKVMAHKNNHPDLYLNQNAKMLGLSLSAFRKIRALANEAASKVFKDLQKEFSERPLTELEALSRVQESLLKKLDEKMLTAIPHFTRMFGGLIE